MLLQKLNAYDGATIPTDEKIAERRLMDKTQKTLEEIVDQQNLKGVLTFFSQAPSLVKMDKSNITTQDLTQFFNNFDELQPSLDLLELAISSVEKGSITLSEQEKSNLLTCQPLVEFLNKERIDLRGLATEQVGLQKGPTATSATKIQLDEPQQH